MADCKLWDRKAALTAIPYPRLELEPDGSVDMSAILDAIEAALPPAGPVLTREDMERLIRPQSIGDGWRATTHARDKIRAYLEATEGDRDSEALSLAGRVERAERERDAKGSAASLLKEACDAAIARAERAEAATDSLAADVLRWAEHPDTVYSPAALRGWVLSRFDAETRTTWAVLGVEPARTWFPRFATPPTARRSTRTETCDD